MQYGNAVKDLLGLDTAPVLSNNGGTSQYAFFSDDAASVDSNFQFSIFQTVEATMAQIAPQIPQMARVLTRRRSDGLRDALRAVVRRARLPASAGRRRGRGADGPVQRGRCHRTSTPASA